MSTVSRVDLDDWLLGLAEAAGAVFRAGTRITEATEEDDRVRVSTTDGGTVFTSRYVIDATGSRSFVAKRMGVELDEVDTGLERELYLESAMEKWRHQIHLDWGPLPGSYGWLFPKKDSLTVGVIASRKLPAATLRGYLDDLTAQLGLERADVLKDSGHLTRCRSPRSPLASSRVLLTGDAAGLLEPWTREGISFAVRSGSAAADVLTQAVRGRISPSAVSQVYVGQLESSILKEMRAGASALEAFERRPEVFHFLMGYTPVGWRYFTRITTGDTNLARAMRHPSVRLGISAVKRARGRRLAAQ